MGVCDGLDVQEVENDPDHRGAIGMIRRLTWSTQPDDLPIFDDLSREVETSELAP